MRYDLYFHNDFDGRASGAILLNFLESRGDSIRRYVPIAFDIKARWPNLAFKTPAIIVDFIYHPRAAFWYDHHVTSFIREDWKKKFKQTKFHQWDASYKSCCHLVLDRLKEYFGFRPPRHLTELARWLDIVDGANFASAKQTIEFKEPALAIDKFIETRSHDEKLDWLIKRLSKESLNVVVKDSRIQRSLNGIKKERDSLLSFYRKNLRVVQKTGIIELKNGNGIDLRFAAYYLKPRLVYNILVKNTDKGFKFSVGTNPWRRKEGKVNIGQLLTKYGGGGHRLVGGLLIKKNTKEKGRIVSEIAAVLNKS